MKKRSEYTPSFDRKKTLYLITAVLLLGYILIKLGLDISHSLFFQKPDRVNFVIYGEYPVFYSLGVKEVGSYAIPFYPDLKTQIPGGYGYYRIGALGKLVQLQKDPSLYRKTFSSITSTFVTYHFASNADEVFYGGHKENVSAKPQIRDILFMNSNATFFDRLYIISYLNRIQPSSLSAISYLPYKRLKDDTVLRNDSFLKKYIGLFYLKTYRNENSNIQIIYSRKDNYTTAEMISSMLNGSGIVVGDLSREEGRSKKCSVIESDQNPSKKHSKTAKDIASFFECDLKKGETNLYDILFVLGENIEKNWEIQ